MGQQESPKQLLIFLSHASEDKPKVRNLCKRLRADGFDPWLDEERLLPGQDWSLEIEKALRASDAILLCFSSLSVQKEGVIQREYKRAMKIQEEKPEGAIFTIPVRLDDCEMPFFIRDLQWVDYPKDYDKVVMALNAKSGGKPMPQKTEKPQKTAPSKPRNTGGTVFNIQGGIHVNRDFIGGDQVNVIHNEQITHISTPAQFVDALQELKTEIAALRSQGGVEPAAARRLNTVEGDIEDAIVEAQKEAPIVQRINSTLEDAKETMQKLGGSIASAVNLGTALGNLAMIAVKIFGG
jgi:hypothetical protein